MIKKLSIALVMLIGFMGCSSQNAFKYSQNLVKKEQSIIPEMTSTEDKVKMFFIGQHYDSIAVAGAKMEKLVDEKLKEIKDEPAPDAKGAEVFKDAFIRYFQFIKTLYTGYKNFGNAPTPEDRDKELTKITELVKQKESVLLDVQSAQKKFAADNNFKLEDK